LCYRKIKALFSHTTPNIKNTHTHVKTTMKGM
jgi:hypothetical protein